MLFQLYSIVRVLKLYLLHFDWNLELLYDIDLVIVIVTDLNCPCPCPCNFPSTSSYPHTCPCNFYCYCYWPCIVIVFDERNLLDIDNSWKIACFILGSFDKYNQIFKKWYKKPQIKKHLVHVFVCSNLYWFSEC